MVKHTQTICLKLVGLAVKGLTEIYYKYTNSLYYTIQSSIVQSAQPAITCSKLTMETLEQGMKYVQS